MSHNCNASQNPSRTFNARGAPTWMSVIEAAKHTQILTILESTQRAPKQKNVLINGQRKRMTLGLWKWSVTLCLASLLTTTGIDEGLHKMLVGGSSGIRCNYEPQRLMFSEIYITEESETHNK